MAQRVVRRGSIVLVRYPFTDFVLEPNHPSFPKTGLKYRSVFRTPKLALLYKSLVLRVLGEMDRDLMNEIKQRLRIALGL